MALLENDVDSLAEYAFDIANRIGLSDWRLCVRVGTLSDPEHGVEVSTHPGAKVAYIVFREDWSQGSAKDLRESVMHELIHLYTRPIKDVVLTQESLLGSMITNLIYEPMTVQEEYAVDMISRIWARSMPLPVKRKAKAA